MEELIKRLKELAAVDVYKMIISKPAKKETMYRRIVIERKESYFQAASYTEKQVFHENIQPENLAEYLISTVNGMYLQVNAWDDTSEHMILISKKGKSLISVKNQGSKLQNQKLPTIGKRNTF